MALAFRSRNFFTDHIFVTLFLLGLNYVCCSICLVSVFFPSFSEMNWKKKNVFTEGGDGFKLSEHIFQKKNKQTEFHKYYIYLHSFISLYIEKILFDFDYFSTLNEEIICKEIFKYLTFEEVLYLGIQSEYLKGAALLEYKRRYDYSMIWITKLGDTESIKSCTPYTLTIDGFEYSLNFLKVIGGRLKSIAYTVQGDEDLSRRKEIEKAIYVYCSQNLKDLHLANVQGDLNFADAFPKIERLIIQWSYLPSHMCKINVLFPNLKYLYFSSWNVLSDPNSFVKSLDKLKLLTFGKALNINFFLLKELNPKLEIIYYKRNRS